MGVAPSKRKAAGRKKTKDGKFAGKPSSGKRKKK